MRRLIAAFAFTSLAAATIAMAQTTPDASAPPADTQSQQQSQQPSDQSASSSTTDQSASSATTDQSTSADKQSLMKDCLTQVQTANPNVSQKDVQAFCDKEVNKSSSSPQ
jgi:hypothetical protein